MASAPQPKKKLTPAQYASINRFRNKRIYQMINEFHLIPKCDKAPYTFESYEEFPDLNRYGNVKCVEATRVKLYNTAYVHANYAPYGASSLILSQGPVNESMSDFINMLYEKKVQIVTMLCNFREDGKDKCAEYFSDAVGEIQCKGFKVKTLSVSEYRPKLFVREIEISNISFTRTHKLIHLQMRDWPDRSIPKETSNVRAIMDRIRNNKQYINTIHCSAGIGRTGCLAAAVIAFEQFEKNQLETVKEVVTKLRECRCQSVQTTRQYVMIFMLVAEKIQEVYDIDLEKVLKTWKNDCQSIKW